MQILLWIGVIILGYLLGSIDFAILITKYIMHDDVRLHGSGNAGTANVARVFGIGIGALTLVGDIAKAALAMLAGSLLLGVNGACTAGAAAVIGHCYPVFFGFKGGKGVAVSAGIAVMIDWRLFLALILVYIIVMLSVRIASVASLSAVILFPPAMFVIGGYAPAQYALGIFAVVMVFVMHRSNIKRLLHGEEGKFSAASRKK